MQNKLKLNVCVTPVLKVDVHAGLRVRLSDYERRIRKQQRKVITAQALQTVEDYAGSDAA